jgi:hypothetical protein
MLTLREAEPSAAREPFIRAEQENNGKLAKQRAKITINEYSLQGKRLLII